MPSHGLKSDQRHPYQKKAVPFWRYNNLPPTMGYSDETIAMFENKKLEFDASCKFISWQTKPVEK